MSAVVTVRPMVTDDAAALLEAFGVSPWHKPRALFLRYVAEQESRSRVCVVGQLGPDLAGYVTLLLTSAYRPFAAEGVPEVSDLNVLPAARRRGVGNALMAAAEAAAEAHGATTVGLGVGLYSDYGSAQRMYVQRGYLFDGRGVMYDNEPVEPGSTICVDDDATLMLTKRLR